MERSPCSNASDSRGPSRPAKFPKDDPELDPDNIKYSASATRPSAFRTPWGSEVDPRSGEIVNASVYVFHDIVKLVNNWRFIQTGPGRQVGAQREAASRGDGRRPALRGDLTSRALPGILCTIRHVRFRLIAALAVVPRRNTARPPRSWTMRASTTWPSRATWSGARDDAPRFGVYDYYAVNGLYTPVYDAVIARGGLQDHVAVGSPRPRPIRCPLR